jgi:hypothetical protein
MSLQLFNGALTNAFQPSSPSAVRNDTIVVDFALAIANVVTPPGTAASIEWYFEFTELDPNAAGATWAREVAEEDVGQGDVRMSFVVRRFAAQAAETDLPPGTYRVSTQFKRAHAFYRVQIRVAAGGADTCSAAVVDPFGTQLQSAP